MNSCRTPWSVLERVRDFLPHERTLEKRMFGGVTFLLNGNMLCCVSKKGLMVRVGKDAEDAALSRPHATPCLGTGRRMAGFIIIQPKGIESDMELRFWLDLARSYVDSLPAKPPRTLSKSSSVSRGSKVRRESPQSGNKGGT